MEEGELSEEQYDRLTAAIMAFMKKRGLCAGEATGLLMSMIIGIFKGNKKPFSQLEDYFKDALNLAKEGYDKS